LVGANTSDIRPKARALFLLSAVPELSAEDVALELNISPVAAAGLLRDFFKSKKDKGLWVFSRAEFKLFEKMHPVPPPSTRRFELSLGASVRRGSLLRAFGGRAQRGIAVPPEVPEIFLFTNPAEGSQFGYDVHEGPRANGSYAYTGEGPSGDQVFTHANRSLRDAHLSGRSIRLFHAEGPRVRYLGLFINDEDVYEYLPAPGEDRKERQAIIFSLLPAAADLSSLPSFVDEQAAVATRFSWTMPNSSDIEAFSHLDSNVGRKVTRIEFALQADFGTWLIARGTPPEGVQFRVGSVVVTPDFYVPSTGWIIEAKKSIARPFLRMAIGQVLDYTHLARKEEMTAVPVILLPGRPEEDMLDLIRSLSIITAFRSDEGFDLIDP
jgi:hypothetical protein